MTAMGSCEPVIVCENLSFRYANSKHPVLDDLVLEVRRGEFVALLGANGSGKSTFAGLLTGLLEMQAGQLKICGTDLSCAGTEDWADLRSRMALLFQDPSNQFVSDEVFEDIAFSLRRKKDDTPENLRQKAGELLKKAGLDSSFLDRSVNTLSGGEQQLVALAGVLGAEPEIIILDEATAMLDPSARKKLLETVKSMHQNGCTVIMITHLAAECTDSDRVILFSGGKIAFSGTPEKVLSRRELLRECNIMEPETVRLFYRLQEAGIPLTGIPEISCENLAGAICRSL